MQEFDYHFQKASKVQVYFKVFSILSAIVLGGCHREKILPEPSINSTIHRENSVITATGVILDLGSGIIDHGFVWANHPSPDLNDHKISLGAKDQTGEFTCTIQGIRAHMNYYIRPFLQSATNTFYGEEQLAYRPKCERIKTIANPIEGDIKAWISLDDEGFIFSSHDSSNQVWQFNPQNTSLIRLPDFPSDPRFEVAFGMSLGDTGYVCTKYRGMSNVFEWWEFDPHGYIWQLKTRPSGDFMVPVFGFGLGGKAYLGNQHSRPNQTWVYDPTYDSWTFIEYPRILNVSLLFRLPQNVLNGKGYASLPLYFYDEDLGYSTWGQSQIYSFDPKFSGWQPVYQSPQTTPHMAWICSHDSALFFAVENSGWEIREYNPAIDSWDLLTEKIPLDSNGFSLDFKIDHHSYFLTSPRKNKIDVWQLTPEGAL